MILLMSSRFYEKPNILHIKTAQELIYIHI